MRHHQAKALAAVFHQAFQPTPYLGDGVEVVSNLSPQTNTPKVLASVAKWHEAPWRKGRRHRVIAQALRTASGTVADVRAEGANDNRPRRRSAA